MVQYENLDNNTKNLDWEDIYNVVKSEEEDSKTNLRYIQNVEWS